MNPPDKILLSYNLYPKGTIEIGYESYRGGMSVGATQIVARLQIPDDCGIYPNDWFPLHGSLGKIKGDIEREKVGDTSFYCIPKWILLDCFSYHWEILWRASKQ